jgi:acyl carrier protein
MSATTTERIRISVQDFIFSNFYVADPGAFGETTSLVREGIIDSTGMLEVLAYLESTFAIRVDEDEVLPQNLESIQNIVTFIGRKQQMKASTA